MPNKFLTTIAWVLESETLKIVDEVISARLTGQVRDLSAFDFFSDKEPPPPSARPYRVEDGVAVIEMFGVMGKRMNMFSAISGGVSTQRVQTLLEDALTDPEIVAVVLHIDSPGGTVDGTADLGDWMLDNKGMKPLHAFIDGQGCSGALWIAACCDAISATRTAQVGSLSAVVCHYDRSVADAKAGIKRTFITSGEYKRAASDAEPLDEKGAAYLQGFIDRYHAMFIEAVAVGRDMSPEEVQAKFGDGRIHLAAEAVKIGMIDGIGTLPETIKAARAAAMEDTMNREEFKAKYPELHAELVAEAETAAKAELAASVAAEGDALITAERSRIFGLYGKLHGAKAGASFEKLAAAGMTAEQIAQLEACGFGLAKNEGAKAEGDTLKKEILAALQENTPAVSAGAGGAALDFMGAVDAEVEKSRCTRTQAMIKVAKTNPELHAAYLQRNNG